MRVKFSLDIPQAHKLALRAASRQIAFLILDRLEENTPVDKGNLQNAWYFLGSDGFHYNFVNFMFYAPIVEHGLYRSVGPRTIQTSEGIFSTQAPRGMVRPTVGSTKLSRDIAAVVNSFLRRK